jgi:hypothetical protein
MINIINSFIKETINEYINHKINTIYDLSDFIFRLNHELDTSEFVLQLDSLLSIDLFPYYLLHIREMNLYQLYQNISEDELFVMKHNITITEYFNDIDLNDPYTFFGCYYIYFLHEHRNEIQPKLLNILHTYQFHF